MDLSKCPADIDFLTLDQVAECYDGISRELYAKLWRLTSACEKARTARPLGGDGSGGTTEEPIIGGGYANELRQAWDRFTDEEKAQIIEATRLD